MRTTYGSPLFRDHVPDRGHAGRRPPAPGRRDRHRQDEHARVRRRLADLQPRLRGDPQPLRSRAHVRRQQRRRSGRRRRGHDPAGRRVRSRRQHPQPGLVLQRRRAAPVARPRPGGAVGLRVESDGRARPAGAQRGGRRAAAAGDGRPGSARAAVAARAAGHLRRSAPPPIRAARASRGAATSAISRSTPR